MIKQTVFIALIFLSANIFSQSTIDSSDYKMLRTIYDEALTNGKSYENLKYLCKNIGHRLSGSENADKSVKWTKKLMEEYGFDNVYLQEVMVPHWVRGEKESAKITGSKSLGEKPLRICALGGSVSCTEGITAEVIEVKNFEELKSHGEEKIKGKIVFFNRPMNQNHINAFEAYGGAVDQRGMGAAESAKYGAVGTLVRSMALRHDDYPHTGALRYYDSIPKIPAAAVSTNDAETLSKLLKEEKSVKVFMKMSCQTLEDAKSYNVIGEIKGSEFPDEIIVVSGHLDSWDAGEGAHDDGAGCMQSVEVLRLFKALGIKPKRTIRAVMYMNEENGLRGAKKYAENAKATGEKHIAAIESDAGAFSPRGFGIDAVKEKTEKVMKWKPLLEEFGLPELELGHSGADIHQLKSAETALFGLFPDSQRYFDYHHANTDVFEAVNRRELELGGAAMAALVYLIDKYGL